MDYFEKKRIYANVISVAYQFVVILKEHWRKSCGHPVNIKASSVEET